MRLTANRPCNYGGKKFFIGDEIPVNLVANAEREEKLGIISIANAGVSDNSGTLFTQEQVDGMIADAVANAGKKSGNGEFYVTVKGEGNNATAVSCNEEDIQTVIDILQMSAEDGAKAVADIRSDSTLILLHALDTRATVKKAAKKLHDTLFSADGNSDESAGGNATTDTTSEGADT